MDIITQNLMKAFKAEETLPEDISDSTLFEHFANFCILSKEYGEEFNLDDIHTGEGGDISLDGIAILVNGSLINSKEEIEDLASSNRYIEAAFVFIQSKTASKFDGADIGNFLFGARDIFNFESSIPKSTKIQEKIDLIKFVYEKPTYFKRGNPILNLYYASTGKWQEDAYLIEKVKADVRLLKDMNIFGDVIFKPVDATELQKLYNYAKNSIVKTIDFERRVTIPVVSGVEEAYLGIIPVRELISFLTDENKLILKGIFYDNVRDFQGENEVNLEIQDTIQSDDKDLFVLLNNGVTIVASSIVSRSGSKLSIQDFQVVNGCQTSHVLCNNRDFVTSNMQIPVRIIISKDDEIKNKIIKATNRQTPVKNEELVALTDFQKTLEKYYEAQPGEHRLYYERRSQQYRSSTGIEKVRVVTVSSQIRSFSSMFLDQPHLAGRYYGNLLESVKGKIFSQDHKPIAYYVSAYTNHKIDTLIRKKQIDEKYRPFKYIMLMALRLRLGGKQMPDMGSRRFETYCLSIQEALWDSTLATRAFDEICLLLDRVLNGDYDRASAKTTRLVQAIKDAI